MLNLYQSNTVEALARLWLAVREPPADPLTPETLLVPSKGMQRWLALWIAQETGIAANLDFQLPASFVWRLIQKAIPGVPARSDFDPDVLVWRMLAVLPDIVDEHPEASLAGSWNASPPRGRYQLAWRVADVFDQYLIYRPDWISQWEAGRRCALGPDEAWQAALWKRLTHGGWHRGRLLQTLEARLRRGEVKGLPKRVCLFGIGTLPPSYWSLVQALAEHVEVDCFVLNPSREYWGQVRRGQPEAHALLSALGQQGRDFLNAVASSGVNEPVGDAAFVASQSDNLLAALQNDLLDQTLRTPDERVPLDPDDDSISIHICHSALREVEVLHDRLVTLFQRDSSLLPHDVLVMVSDIQRYAPLVDAVFGTRRDPGIPYTIADRKLDIEVPLLRRFFDVLALPSSRFELPRVMALLEEPALCARFGLEAGDIPLLQRWCEELQLRWGRDAEDRRQRGLPADTPITWRAGLDRLLLGFALPVEMSEALDHRLQGIAPASLVGSVSQARVMARFAGLINALLAWEKRLLLPRTLLDWAQCLEELLQAFFADSEDSQPALQALRDAVTELREQARLAADEAVHEFSVMQAWLKRQVQGLESRRGFLHGAVTVCAMVPMRSLPFRVIAVLGLDDGVFPRHQKPWHFDLMTAQPRAGDRSRRLDDRYLFLESLMAAREKLYLSYIGRSDVDDSVRAPSPVLVELMDQIRDTAVTEAGGDVLRAITTTHALQPFNPDYFISGGAHPSYVRRFFEASRALMANGVVAAEPVAHQPLDAPEADWLIVTAERLERFLRHPARFLLRERMGVQLEGDAELLLSEEPVDLWATRRHLRERLLQQPDLDVAVLAAEGLLPSGAWGECLVQGEAEKVGDLHTELQAALATRLAPQVFQVEQGGCQISASFSSMTPEGLLRWTIGDDIYNSDVLGLWLQHLLLCTVRPEGVECRSRLLGLKRSIVLEPVEKPATHLAAIVEAYVSGLRQPLPLFMRASPALVKPKGDISKATNAYLGSEFATGDADDAWNRLAWGDGLPLGEVFESWAERIYGPIRDHLS